VLTSNEEKCRYPSSLDKSLDIADDIKKQLSGRFPKCNGWQLNILTKFLIPRQGFLGTLIMCMPEVSLART
jgi:hypothetical protein